MHWLERLLRLPARPLQIPEILEAAKEHLRVVALEGLTRKYLPVRLSIAVASDDFRALAPFVDELRQELRGVVERLAARPRYLALAPEIALDLIEAEDLAPGSAPRFHATFPGARTEASWRPGEAASPVLEASPAEEGTGLLEAVLTTASEDRTGLQTVYVLCLDETLPARAFDPRRTGARLRVDGEGALREVGSGEPWRGAKPLVRRLETALPERIEAGLPLGASASTLYRFHRPGRSEVLWAPRGVLLIGRRPELVHWVPGGAPRNLSGRHFALLRGAAGAPRLVDLESTNGTYVDGRRLRPFETVTLVPPASVEVGTEETVRLDLRLSESVDSET